MAVNPETPRPARREDALEQAFMPERRIVIAAVTPSVGRGRYSVKRCVGDLLRVESDVFADGHEQLAAQLAIRAPGSRAWQRLAMAPIGNDRWRAETHLSEAGLWHFRIEAWLDRFGGFVRDTEKKRDAGLPVTLEIEEGRLLLAEAAASGSGAGHRVLNALLEGFERLSAEDRLVLLLAPETRKTMQAMAARPYLVAGPVQKVDVERPRAGFASWYELFPRSQSGQPGRHGTFRDVIGQLPRIRAMGFDVLYLTPIHPIGKTNRKGRNNSLLAATNDPGSAYAIGSQAGGHDAIHPELGNARDFRALVAAAKTEGMEIALDIAVQMSPDHPWLQQHPGWFPRRPDGSMKYAENPPKKYEDIVNPDFYADPQLWIALREIFLHWIGEGVRIFRVDNPHTKPLPFWEWVIADIRSAHPDVIFLAEAFTRPTLMYQLARIGFNESYTYFTWRNTKRELTNYLTELSTGEVREFFRPHFFVNTPDINPPFLQTGGRAAFLIRAALAATMSGLWGVYSGFELYEAEPLPGREEYKDSEKYELKQRDFAAPGNIAAEIAQLNAIRAAEPALQSHLGITFYNAFNDNILYYAKTAPGRSDRILVAVNLDPHNAQGCDFEVPLWEWNLADHESVAVEDLLHGYKFTWTGKIQHLHLTPLAPYAIWRLQPMDSAP
ncbi:MAG TPA: alpha-1,4-glucan--maltose-1-phosphate maltosyltransferase [Rhizomicrobium sp.]|nr:alpha-1,4-glucan--maltose-1-phosphate maltosyltransferase [Rhizomicrobium sp.]